MLFEEIADILINSPRSIGKMLLDKKVTSEEVKNVAKIMSEGIEYAMGAVKLFDSLEILRSNKDGIRTDSELAKALNLISEVNSSGGEDV
jgi:hypothetical protein